MAHIVRFRVDGLAGRSDPYEQDLDPKVNIFFGENGSGKTTLLRILQSALALDASLLAKVSFTRAEVLVHSIERDADFLHVVEKPKDESPVREHVIRAGKRLSLDRSPQPLQWTLTPPPSRAVSRWGHSWLPTTRLYAPESSAEYLRTDTRSAWIEDAFPRLLSAVWNQYTQLVLRDTNEAQSSGIAAMMTIFFGRVEDQTESPAEDIASIHRRVSAFLARQRVPSIEGLGSLQDFTSRFEKDEKFRLAAIRLNDVEVGIEVSQRPRTRLQDLVSTMLSRGKTLSMDEGELQINLPGGTPLNPALLSSGEKHLFLLLLSTMAATRGTVIVDEPELSMHVAWQQSLVDCMREVNPDAQLIMATHSPEILAACERIAPNATFRM